MPARPSNHTTKDCPLAIRGIDHGEGALIRVGEDSFTAAIGVYSFANGVIRGVAAATAWWMLVKLYKDQMGSDLNWAEESVASLVESLLNIPCLYELHGDGSERACLIAQMARQNQAAEVQPLSVLQWIQLVIQRTEGGEAAFQNRSGYSRRHLQDTLDGLAREYDAHPEVLAYDDPAKVVREPAAKKRRSSKASKEPILVENEDTRKGIRLGVRKLIAIMNFLKGGTLYSLHLLLVHTHRTEFRYSCLTDEIMSIAWLYVGSEVPKEFRPAEASSPPVGGPPPHGIVLYAVQFEEPLRPEEHDLLFHKGIAVFTDRAVHLDHPAAKAKARSSAEEWYWMRCIVQFYIRTLKPCFAKELTPEDMEENEATILGGTALDSELRALLERRITQFHVGMLASFAERHQSLVSEQSQKLLESIRHAAQGRLKMFLDMLEIDHAKIRELTMGQVALADILVWLENSHQREQIQMAEDPAKIITIPQGS